MTNKLPDAVKGSVHTPLELTWSPTLDLTGATLSAVREPVGGGTETPITGTLSVVDAESGVFRWTYSAADVGTAGNYRVKFTADYGGGDLEISKWHDWKVQG